MLPKRFLRAELRHGRIDQKETREEEEIMSALYYKALKSIAWKMLRLGFNPWKIASYRYYPQFRKQRKKWLEKGGKINDNYMILSDYTDSAGCAKGHYFHQDLLVAKLIFENNPQRHIDIGSRVDGFVAHLASFREVEVIDIRPLGKSVHENIKFMQADLMNRQELAKTDSLSCLHAVEHFGLGRYRDPIEVDGHKKGIENLIDMVKKGGRLYISFPIGKEDEVHFNAHRVSHPKSILEYPSIAANMILSRFDFVDDDGDLHLNVSVDSAVGRTKYGCGIYTFEKL
jgi:hypothetical protein